MLNTIEDNIQDPMFFFSPDIFLTATIIISTLLKLKDARAFAEDRYSKLGGDRASSVSEWKQKMGK